MAKTIQDSENGLLNIVSKFYLLAELSKVEIQI